MNATQQHRLQGKSTLMWQVLWMSTQNPRAGQKQAASKPGSEGSTFEPESTVGQCKVVLLSELVAFPHNECFCTIVRAVFPLCDPWKQQYLWELVRNANCYCFRHSEAKGPASKYYMPSLNSEAYSCVFTCGTYVYVCVYTCGYVCTYVHVCGRHTSIVDIFINGSSSYFYFYFLCLYVHIS